MLPIPRIGLFFGPSMDPFWVQVLEAIYQKAEDHGLDLIAIDSDLPPVPSGEDETALYEELLAQDLDIVIGWGFTEALARRVLASGVPIVVADTPVAREVYGPAAEYVRAGDVEGTAAAIHRFPNPRSRRTVPSDSFRR